MPAVPKKRHTRARKGNKNAHAGLIAPNFKRCPDCEAFILPHNSCQKCGTYGGRKLANYSDSPSG